jgi:uroporphyrinogen-III synthase
MTDLQALEGFTIGVTADRRREELSTFFERRGARVVSAPTLRIIPCSGDQELCDATAACIDRGFDVALITTGIGFRGWMEAADGWGLGDALRNALAASELIARGPKARGAIRAAGLTEVWCPESESVAEVLDHLLDRGVAGRRIAIQLHGEPLDRLVAVLHDAGAEVMTVAPYRWSTPSDESAALRLINLVIGRVIDGLVFTSAPAALAMLALAQRAGLEDDLIDAMRTDTVVTCVGPICAAPLVDRGIDVVLPARARLGSLVKSTTEAIPHRRTIRLSVAGRELEIRGHLAVLDGEVRPLQPAPMALLRALASSQGRVLTREELADRLPGDTRGARGVEMTVTRLRSALGDPSIIETVAKRGYRLVVTGAVDGPR